MYVPVPRGAGRRFIENQSPYDSPHGKKWSAREDDDGGMPYEEAFIPSADGVPIHVLRLWAPADVDTRAAVTIIYCHSKDGNMGYSLPSVKAIAKAVRCNVVLWDYRGYGASGGKPSEKGIRADASALGHWLVRCGDIDMRKVFWYGLSLGGAVAAHAVADAFDNATISALIIENTFTSIPALTNAHLPFIKTKSQHMLYLNWDTASIAAQLGARVPTIFISGSADIVVPPRLMLELYKAFTEASDVMRLHKHRAPNHRLVTAASAAHMDVRSKMLLSVVSWEKEIANFVRQTLVDKLIYEEVEPRMLSPGDAVTVMAQCELYVAPRRAAHKAKREVKKILDIVISHPRAHSEPRVADTPGIAAYIAALKKVYLYYNNFVIPAGHMVPISAETGGRFDGAFSNFLKEVVTSGLYFGESPVPVWTKEKRALFTSRLRSAHVTCDNFLCYRTLRCKCPNLWVEDYRTVPCA